MKKIVVLFVTCFLVIGNCSPVTAQVKIGGNAGDPITPGTVLDLSSATSGGLLLPRVTLSTATALPNEWIDIVENTDLLESGLMVYNLGGAESLAPGVYIWQGTNGWALANSGGGSGPVPESITISADPIGWVTVDATQTLTATVLPINAGWSTVNWSGNVPSVALVDAVEGSLNTATVTGIHNGTTTITASLDGLSSDPFTIRVGIPVESVSITPTTTPAIVQQGKTYQLTATVLPDNATDKSLTWTSSDPSIATVDNTGLVTAFDTNGTTTITVVSNQVASVVPTPAGGIVINVSSCPGADNLFDTRDGQCYQTIMVNGVKWMAENLAYTPQAVEDGVSYTYNGADLNLPSYKAPPTFDLETAKTTLFNGGRPGYLYTWAGAMKASTASSLGNGNYTNRQGICPENWHIPTQTEWQNMLTYVYANPATFADLSKIPNGANADTQHWYTLASQRSNMNLGSSYNQGASYPAGIGMNFLGVINTGVDSGRGGRIWSSSATRDGQVIMADGMGPDWNTNNLNGIFRLTNVCCMYGASTWQTVRCVN
ncbi:MAG: Ig-like domain-containing protein [Candidatus Symbiothrix sp.]|nr:Ig-like domain-containing protein [Candidatus Symbiothrix sp.]